MKNNVLCCFFLICSITILTAQESIEAKHQLDWKENYSNAERIAKKENKNLLIYFTGSDWCGPCKMLVEDFFNSKKFFGLSENFVLYEANFPRNKDLVTKEQQVINKKLKSRFRVTSYPTILILKSNGKEIGRRKGYNLMRDVSYHFNFIESYLK